MRSYGNPDAPITIVSEPGAFDGEAAKRLLWNTLREYGFERDECYIVYAFPTMPEAFEASESKQGKWIKDHRPAFLERLSRGNPKAIIAFGKLATRACSNKAVKITRARGQAWEYEDMPAPVLTCYSPAHVLRRPELLDIFASDLLLLERFRDTDWDFEELMKGHSEASYKWCTDLQFLIDMKPKVLAVDTETTGLDWYRPEIRPLTVQLSWAEGQAIAVPVSAAYWQRHVENQAPKVRRRMVGYDEEDTAINRRTLPRIVQQLKTLLENPETKCVAHNMSFDHHILTKLDIRANWWMDTQVMAFCADDNMSEKSQDECVRRWIPEMAGYADAFNRKVDKSRMIDVPPDEMLPYACGDADALYRLTKKLWAVCSRDERQYKLLEKVQMPALRAFATCVEENGVNINVEELDALQVALDIEYEELNSALLDLIPPAIRRKHAEKGLRFTRDALVRDILFTEDGLDLTPLMFTPSTRKLPPEEQVPSASKDHMAFFAGEDIEFIDLYLQWSTINKMRTTYVGREFDEKKDGPTGFYKYLHENTIYPSFNLHVTVTGRTSSRNPNAQNFPKRGRLAKAFRKIFKAREGYTLIECDLSQAELRIAAWMAHEEMMLSIYAQDGDIHSATAAAVLGVTTERFLSWKGRDDLLQDYAHQIPGAEAYLGTLTSEEAMTRTLDDFVSIQRFRAKAVNFGFLYGMGWRKFKTYAKTDYGLSYSDAEAQHLRDTFFELYPGLVEWHEDMTGFVQEYGYVRALHGALRRLPAVFSTQESMQWAAVRQAINSPVQRFASDLGLIALSRLVRDCPRDIIKPIMFVHDALILEVKDEYLEETCETIKFYMESSPLEGLFDLTPPIPIRADVSVGKSLGAMEELSNVVARPPEWYQPNKDKELVFA